MNNVYCAPDLPFWQTLVWHLKQMAATGLIMVVVLSCLFMAWIFLSRQSK